MIPDEDFSPSFRSNLPCWCLSDEETIAETEKIAQEVEEEGIQILLASAVALLRLLLDIRTLRGYSFATPAEERSLADILLLRERVNTFKQEVHRLQGLLISSSSEENLSDFLFDDRLSRLYQVGPVRKINRADFPQALSCLEKVSTQWVEIISIAEWLNGGTRSFDDVLSCCIRISSSSSHHMLARSLFLIALLHAVNGLPSMILQSMELHAVPEKISTADPTCCEWVSTGSPRVAVWELLKALMVCRRRLFHRLENILILWGQVMSEALYLDEQLRSKVAVSPSDKEVQPWYSSWAVLFVCKTMDLYMSVMLEADILDPAELDYFFWYWDYIHSVHSHASDRLGSMRYQYDTSSKKVEPRKEKKDKNVKEVQKIEEHCGDEFILKGRGLLCKGIFRSVVLLKRLSVIDSKCSDYTLRSNVFLRRFKPFQEVLNPGPLSFEDFLKTVGGSEGTVLNNDQRKIELEALLDSSLLCFKHARSYFDEARKSSNGSNRGILLIGDTTSSVGDSVAVAYSLSLMKLKQEGFSFESTLMPVTVNKSYHRHFPVLAPQLKHTT
eukprot:scaffold229_cov155-Ochromonas_danica.AAC.3